jgi:hypothetical protein
MDRANFPAQTKHRVVLTFCICLACLLAAGLYWTWNLRAERRVDRLFAALEGQDFPQAFAIWNDDPDWQQHAQRYAASGYPYGRFVSDWSSGSEYGSIKSHKIVYATSRYGNHTLLAVEINGRQSDPLTLAVEKSSHAMSFPPFALAPVSTGFGWTDWQLNYR